MSKVYEDQPWIAAERAAGWLNFHPEDFCHRCGRRNPGSPVNVRLPADLHAAATDRARADDRSLASLIRCALRFYLAQTEPPAPGF
jgi:hypothetical protein